MSTRFTPDFDQMECEREAARKERDDALAKLAQAEKERDAALQKWQQAAKDCDFETGRALERKHEIERLRAKLAEAEQARDRNLDALNASAKGWGNAHDELRRERDAFKAQREEAIAKLADTEERLNLVRLVRDEALAELAQSKNDLLHAKRGRLDDWILAGAEKQRDEAAELVARLRREKLTLLADFAGVLATVVGDNPELTQYLDVLEGLAEQMTDTVRDLKEAGQ